MNKILISALLLTAGYAFGQMEIGWDSSNLKKKVKSIKETMYYLPTEDMGGVKQEISDLERKRITYTLEGEKRDHYPKIKSLEGEFCMKNQEDLLIITMIKGILLRLFTLVKILI